MTTVSVPPIPRPTFETLAHGGGGSFDIALLQQAEAHLNAVRLVGVISPAIREAGDSVSLDAWDLLERVDQHVVSQGIPDQVAQELDALRRVCNLPLFGAWVRAATLAVMSLGDSTALPASAEVGHATARPLHNELDARQRFTAIARLLGGYAATAACWADMDFTLHTAADAQGQWHLPAIGRIHIQPNQPLTIRRIDGRLTAWDDVMNKPIPLPEDLATPSDAWKPARYLHAVAAGRELKVLIDRPPVDNDMFGWAAADELSDERYALWQEAFVEAWPMLVKYYPEYAAGIEAGFRTIVPLQDAPQGTSRSVTNESAFGAAAMTAPGDATQLALALLHEFQHSKLAALWHAVTLHKHVDETPAYAPWREDSRPVHNLLQGAYAHAGIADFWRTWAASATDPGVRLRASVEYLRIRQEVEQTIQTIRQSDNLNENGVYILDCVVEQLQCWNDSAIPSEAVYCAELSAIDHRLGWQLRNAEPDAQLIARMAAAWKQGRPCPTDQPCTTTINRENIGKDFALTAGRARRSLTNLFLRDRADFERLIADQEELRSLLPTASPADVSFVSGAVQTARRQYLGMVAASPGQADPWSGLALTFWSPEASDDPRAQTLLRHPEYVYALYRALDGQADPLALAAWLAPAAHPVSLEA